MTRKEQIRQAALEACRSSEIPDKELDFRGVNSAYGLGFCEGAMWADRNPKDDVNWQQVRIQAAISAMQGFLASKTMMEIVDETVKIGQLQGIEVSADSAISRMSIGFADALVKELKGE